MTSLCRHLSVVSSGNCKLGHDCRRVCSHRRHDVTRQFCRVGIGGVYWTLQLYAGPFSCSTRYGENKVH